MERVGQKLGNQQTVIKISSALKGVGIHQHAEFQAISPPMCSQENTQKLKTLPVSLSQNATKMRKINRP